MEKCTNEQKYLNYKEQMGRLNRAINNEFYLEAIFIEGAIIEDRVESFLRTSGGLNLEKQRTLDRKLSRLCELQRNKKSEIRKYLSDELLESVYQWKSKRNPLVHALLKREIATEELISVVNEGYAIVKKLNNGSTSYRRKMTKNNQADDVQLSTCKGEED